MTGKLAVLSGGGAFHRYNEIISLGNLCLAWEEFVRGKRGKTDVQVIERNLADNLLMLRNELVSQTYRHGPYKRFSICDPKSRVIHKAPVRDRLVHHAVHRILYPFFDRLFIADSFSCRLGKGTHGALDRFNVLARKVSHNHTRTCWVLKCDIRKFFASIDHRVLMRILTEKISDRKTLWLLKQIIGSFSSGIPGVGLPLGNLTSQLFANVLMNEFDQFVKHRIKARNYVRYADDFVLLSEDKSWLVSHLLMIRDFLSQKLHLTLHPDKVSIKTFASGIDFLGWVNFPDHRVMRTVTKRRMMRRLAEHPTNETLQSCLGLMRHGNARKSEKEARNLYWLYRKSY